MDRLNQYVTLRNVQNCATSHLAPFSSRCGHRHAAVLETLPQLIQPASTPGRIYTFSFAFHEANLRRSCSLCSFHRFAPLKIRHFSPQDYPSASFRVRCQVSHFEQCLNYSSALLAYEQSASRYGHFTQIKFSSALTALLFVCRGYQDSNFTALTVLSSGVV